jgi:uncharacterized protein YqeY
MTGIGEPQLKARLQADLTAAIKSRDELATATLRMALTAVTNEEVAGKQVRVLSDDEVLAVLRRELKKRTEAAQAFADGGRAESAQRERDEADVLQGYLPAQLDDAELGRLVAEAVASVGATSPREMGPVMKAVQPMVAGRADGGRVAAAVKAALAAG